MGAALIVLTAGGPSRNASAADGIRVAQQAEPRITVASTILAESATQASLAIAVGPSDTLPPNSFIRLRGLPPRVSLSVGHAITSGVWAIPLFGLTTLKVNIPAGVLGRSEIVVSLVTIDGTQLAEANTALVVGPSAMLNPASGPGLAAAEPKSAGAPAPPVPIPASRSQRGTPPSAPVLSAEARAHAEHMLAQGERYLEQGNITPARQFFRKAAEAGLARGAIRLATTYDPVELRRMKAQGALADAAEARKWYERARDLGAPDAEERLARLAPGN
jgi:hypothetical protein